MKPDCYKCEYRGGVAGSAHSSCNHPAYKEVMDDPMSNMMAIFASVGRVNPIQTNTTGINVKGNQHGIRRGWFNHPFNFDPTWLESCDGFKNNKSAE